MVKHQKTLLRTDESPTAPWKVGCSCGWFSQATDEKQAGKLHTEHRKDSKPSFRLSRMFGRVILYVKIVPSPGGTWGYTPEQNEAFLVDDKTRARYMRHLRDCGIKGTALLVTAQPS